MNESAARPWGYHLLLDVAGCVRAFSSDPNHIAAWVRDLVQAIGMTPHGAARVERFGEGDLRGVTVVQLITTSSIVAHFNDVDGSCFADIFSCKAFDPKTVQEHFAVWFAPVEMRAEFLERRVSAPVGV